MKKFFTEILLDPVSRALSTIVAGVLITVFHSVALDIVCIALGCVLAVIGLINIIKYFRTPMDTNFNLLTGLIFAALGITIIIDPASLLDLVAVAFGIIILYHGIVNLQSALLLKKLNYKFWYLALIFALVTVFAGVLLITLKNQIIKDIALISGIILIVEGALNTWTAVKVKKSNV